MPFTNHRSLFTFLLVLEDQSQRLFRVNPFVELFLQSAFSLSWQIAFCRFFPGELRQDRQFALHFVSRNSIPKAVFKREDVHLILLDVENLSVRSPDDDFIRSNIDGQILSQIESGFNSECSVQLYPLRAAYFFFSSRRRHTRWTGDWSSDVCSSD